MGLTLYPEDALEGVDVQVGLGQQLLELGVLALEFAQALGYMSPMQYEQRWLAAQPKTVNM